MRANGHKVEQRVCQTVYLPPIPCGKRGFKTNVLFIMLVLFIYTYALQVPNTMTRYRRKLTGWAVSNGNVQKDDLCLFIEVPYWCIISCIVYLQNNRIEHGEVERGSSGNNNTGGRVTLRKRGGRHMNECRPVCSEVLYEPASMHCDSPHTLCIIHWVLAVYPQCLSRVILWLYNYITEVCEFDICEMARNLFECVICEMARTMLYTNEKYIQYTSELNPYMQVCKDRGLRILEYNICNVPFHVQEIFEIISRAHQCIQIMLVICTFVVKSRYWIDICIKGECSDTNSFFKWPLGDIYACNIEYCSLIYIFISLQYLEKRGNFNGSVQQQGVDPRPNLSQRLLLTTDLCPSRPEGLRWILKNDFDMHDKCKGRNWSINNENGFIDGNGDKDGGSGAGDRVRYAESTESGAVICTKQCMCDIPLHLGEACNSMFVIIKTCTMCNGMYVWCLGLTHKVLLKRFRYNL